MAEYYTDELMQTVREAYRLDYIVWDKIKAHKGSHMDGAKLCSNDRDDDDDNWWYFILEHLKPKFIFTQHHSFILILNF